MEIPAIVTPCADLVVRDFAVSKTPTLPPDQYTEEQFFEAGRMLARIEHGMQWAIGDWYNAISEAYGDKKAACERAGLDPGAAQVYGSVAKTYEPITRIMGLTFKHHQVVASVSVDQRASLLRLAEWGEEDKDGKRKPWTASRLAQERDKLLGREKVPLPDFDEKVDQTVYSLPKNVGEKAGRVDCHGLPG